MVYQGENSFVVTCNCHCDNSMIVKVLDDTVFITFVVSEFYNKQHSINNSIYNIKENIKHLYCIANHKKYYLNEIILDIKDKDIFINALNSIKVKDGGEKISNSALFEINIDKEFKCISLALLDKTPLIEILKGKTYRAFDIALNKKQWNSFVEYLKKELEQ